MQEQNRNRCIHCYCFNMVSLEFINT